MKNAFISGDECRIELWEISQLFRTQDQVLDSLALLSAVGTDLPRIKEAAKFGMKQFPLPNLDVTMDQSHLEVP